MVKVSHGSRYSTAYLHLSRIGKGVRKGTRVRRGQVIGAVGRTGYATGPHLHFSLYDRGRYVDPFKVPLPTQGPEEKHAIGTRYLAAALNTLQHYGKIQVASNEQT